MRKLINLITNDLNQNDYHFNKFSSNQIGILYILPVDIIPEDCLSCDGYILKINDYNKLYSVIGNKFNTGEEANDEFRIPDYNITEKFLQPSTNVGIKRNAGLPAHKHYEFCSVVNGTSSDNKTNQQLRNDMQVNSLWYSGYAAYNLARTSSAADVGLSSNPTNSSIYGQSSTVQPSSETVHICIKYK